MSPDFQPIGPGDSVPPITPVPRTGDATSKSKDEPERQLKKRVDVQDDGTILLHPDEGEPVRTTAQEFVDAYRKLFGEDPPPGSIIDIKA